jgi:hypothetical protein
MVGLRGLTSLSIALHIAIGHQSKTIGRVCSFRFAVSLCLHITMTVCFNLLLLVLATTWLTHAFQPFSEQQRLKQGKPHSAGTFGDASFDEFVVQAIHAYHVPGLSIAVIENGQTSAKVVHERLAG